MGTKKQDLIFATIGIGIAIILGAFGAHFLKSKLTDTSLSSFNTGVQYQLFMCVGLLGIANINMVGTKSFRYAIKAIKIGTLLFSGSIYLLTIKNLYPSFNFLSIAGPITPIGGVFLIIGWFKFAFLIWTSKE
jgi:uncharacterized membrane protein YgdD (TMEM256/DUF423 family)